MVKLTELAIITVVATIVGALTIKFIIDPITTIQDPDIPAIF